MTEPSQFIPTLAQLINQNERTLGFIEVLAQVLELTISADGSQIEKLTLRVGDSRVVLTPSEIRFMGQGTDLSLADIKAAIVYALWMQEQQFTVFPKTIANKLKP